MSNIYDSANELSRGLRGLPEYKAVKAAKDAIAADAEASKIFTEYLVFQEEIQKLAHTGQMPDASFQAKMEGFGKQIQGNSLLSEFFTKQQQLAIYLSDIEKIVFEPVSELLK
ncbi:TPA: YlbF/YmcA family competence regulator [Streptococcus pneumoniae]